MGNFFLKVLDAEPEEGRRVFFLLLQGFLLGVFVATYDVSSSAVFLRVFDDSHLSVAIAVSGFLGIVLTYIYAILQARIRYSLLALINQITLTLLVCLLTVGIFLFRNNEILTFAAFVFLGPANAIALLNFWGIFSRIFNSRQAKRLSGGIDTGQMLATIIGFFSIPLIQKVFPEEEDFLFISSASLIASIFTIVLIIKNFDLHVLVEPEVKKPETAGKTGFLSSFKNRYILLMGLFIITSAMMTELIDFSFLSVIEKKYLSNQKNIAEFLGLFTGSIMIVGFIIQTFLDDKILEMFGMKVSLMIMPVLLIGFAILAIVVGYIFGYTAEATSFGVFFIVIAVIKLISESLKGSLEGRVFKIFYMPLAPGLMLDTQTKIEGVVTQFAGLLAGSIILGFNFIHFFDTIHYQFLLIGLGVVYVYYTIHLHTEYKKSLHKTLSNSSNEQARTNLFILLPEEVTDKKIPAILSSLISIKSSDPLKLQEISGKLLKLNNPLIKNFIHNLSLNFLRRENQETKSDLNKLFRSANYKDRIEAAYIASGMDTAPAFKYLSVLLRDESSTVKLAAITAAGKSGKEEFWPLLIDFLHSDVYGNVAASALSENGERVVPVLDHAFYRSDQTVKTMEKILDIFGRVRGIKAKEALWTKIRYPDKTISGKALHMLARLGYVAKEEEVLVIKNAIDQTISDMVWNLASIQELKGGKDRGRSLIVKALEEENEANFNFLFLLLSMIYDSKSVAAVKANIITGISEKVGFALELMDVFVSDDQKPKLFPLLNDISNDDKIRTLTQIFPRQPLPAEETLIAILNRDYNQINKWTKLTALLSIQEENIAVSDDLVALLFHPDLLLQQTAAWVIFSKDKEKYQECSSRISPSQKKQLDFLLTESQDELKVIKMLIMRNLKGLDEIPGVTICLLESFTEINFFREEKLLWNSLMGNNPYLTGVIEGELRLVVENGTEVVYSEGDLVGELIFRDENLKWSLKAIPNTRIALILKDKFFEFLADEPERIEKFIQIHTETKEILAEASIN